MRQGGNENGKGEVAKRRTKSDEREAKKGEGRGREYILKGKHKMEELVNRNWLYDCVTPLESMLCLILKLIQTNKLYR